jgi:RimJ/RimL family protein N-acetyltransferase
MRYLSGRAETLEETAASIERVKQCWLDFGYSWWSLIDKASGEIVGAACLQHLRQEVSARPDPSCPLEIGWRLKREHWGQGLASEAARAIATHAFDSLNAPELYAVCDPANTASAKVMQGLGMVYGGLQTWYGEPLATYQMDAAQWREACRTTEQVR